MPRFSILSATFDNAPFLLHSYSSLYDQSFTDFEHLIQDGSGDSTIVEILKNLQDSRQKILRAKDDGIYDALNRAFYRSSGDIVGVLHSDDFFASRDVLDMVHQVFMENDAHIVYGDVQYVDRKSASKTLRTWRSQEFDRSKLKFGWMPPHTGFFIRRDIMESAGSYDNTFKISGDYEAMLRWLSLDNIRAVYLSKTIVKMRAGGASNGSIKKKLVKSREDRIAMMRHGIRPFWGLFCKNLRKLGQLSLMGERK